MRIQRGCRFRLGRFLSLPAPLSHAFHGIIHIAFLIPGSGRPLLRLIQRFFKFLYHRQSAHFFISITLLIYTFRSNINIPVIPHYHAIFDAGTFKDNFIFQRGKCRIFQKYACIKQTISLMAPKYAGSVFVPSVTIRWYSGYILIFLSGFFLIHGLFRSLLFGGFRLKSIHLRLAYFAGRDRHRTGLPNIAYQMRQCYLLVRYLHAGFHTRNKLGCCDFHPKQRTISHLS